MAHPNEEILRSIYQAMADGDAQAFLDALADDIVWHAPPGSQVSGTYQGKSEVRELFGRVQELTGGNFRVEAHDVLANDEHGVGLVRARGQRDGISLDEPVVHVAHVADGKVTEFWAHPFDAAKFNDFFS